MRRVSSQRLLGNDVFEGYAIDLIKEIAEILSMCGSFLPQEDIWGPTL